MVEGLQQLLLEMARGVSTTLSISIFSFVLGLIIGFPLSFIRAYGSKPLQLFVDGFEKVFRGIPELVLMLMFFFGVGFFVRYPFKNAFFTATFALALRSAANQSQIFRGAIRGVGEEQMTTARSLGLSGLGAILYVMAPQVFFFSTPGLGSEYALLVKDSSYAFIIGVLEIMEITDRIVYRTMDFVMPYLAAAFLYILLTFPIATWLDTWGSRKKKQLGL